jgi:hypothetical protein
MIGPVVLFSLLIAVLWAWSVFTHPQMRCSRCTGAAAYPGAVAHTHERHLPQMRWDRHA